MDKDLIIDKAFKVIVQNGLEGFSIAKLAKELDCTKSSIYNYFNSKDDLLNQIFVTKTKLLKEGIDINEDDPDVIIRKYAHNCIENRDVFTFFHKYAHSNFVNKETMNEIKKEIKMTQQVVHDLAEKYATSSEVNPIIIEALIFGPIHGLVMRTKGQDINVTHGEIDSLVDFILSTIRKEEDERNN